MSFSTLAHTSLLIAGQAIHDRKYNTSMLVYFRIDMLDLMLGPSLG